MIDSSWFQIDQDRLDEEWSLQSSRVYEVCAAISEAKRHASETKRDLDVTKSEIRLDIRRHPMKYNLQKVTEDTVDCAMQISAAYDAAFHAWIIAEHELDVLQDALTALQHKKSALENFVSLHAMAYFGDPDPRRPTKVRTKHKHFNKINKTREDVTQ